MEGNTLDAALRALASTERRDVLSELLETDEVEIPDEDYEKVLKLSHDHLPRLADDHYIEYEHAEKGVTVRRGSRFEELAPLLDHVLDFACE